MSPPAPDDLLRADGIVKRFGGITALDGVSFDLRPGEVHALCGENGAGKSTLIKILGGIHPAGSFDGTLSVGGTPARFASVRDAEHAGIAVITQELALVEAMTVAENVFLGVEPRLGRWGWLDRDRMLRETRALLARFGVSAPPDARVAELGVGLRQLVEIVKALRKQARILVLDEPTAALSETEVRTLLDTLRDLRRRGIACIYISHRLEEVLKIADRITVLRDGRSVSTRNVVEASRDTLIRDMVGRPIADLFPRREVALGAPLLSVSNLTVAERADGPPLVEDVSFEVRAGEVLGIGGLMGAGRSELLLHLFGAWGTRRGGTVTLGGQALPADLHPSDVLGRGLVLVSEDRKRYGLVLERSVGFNLSLSTLPRVTHGGLIDADAERRRSTAVFDNLRIKAAGLEAPVSGLSGGNQQKVVLGKALLCEPRVVLLDEPTRGIDVGAKLEVYELVNRMCAEGKAVVLVSSELPELLGMSDRIVMLRRGQIGGSFTRSEATQERLLAAAMTGAAGP